MRKKLLEKEIARLEVALATSRVANQKLQHSLYYRKDENKVLEKNLSHARLQTEIWRTDFFEMKKRIKVAIREEH